jgi:integrase
MAGWILERKLRSGALVYDIGYRVNGRLVKRKAGATRREAEAALVLALAEVESGVIRDHTTETLGVYAMRWLTRRAPFIESGTESAYRNDIVWRIAPTLGALRLRDVTAETIEQAIVEMQRMKPRRGSGRATYSAKTINNTLTTLSGILGAAVNDGLLRQNPARRQGGAGERRMRVREEFCEVAYLMPDEIPGYLEACDPAYRDLAEVLSLGGLRISEALALEPRDIAADDGVIIVARQLKNGTGGHLKDKTPRSVEIGPRLAERLERRAHATRRARGRVLFAEPDGSYIDRTIIARRWHEPALRDAGIGMHLRVHDLRHTAAAAWLIAGKQSLEYVRRQLGHASIRQTQVYAHLERRGRGRAAAHTEDAVWAERTGGAHLRTQTPLDHGCGHQ